MLNLDELHLKGRSFESLSFSTGGRLKASLQGLVFWLNLSKSFKGNSLSYTLHCNCFSHSKTEDRLC
ncbi:hypothetical protein A946_07510 [Methylacidiphilum kamchatkense Kam1]|uniref:Uncharacterized protein n=1 Tax=Methylacidiphilum kamchatkense Kam1 TaxID=1202785 RepID=A0ABR4ZW56_9BACT|nr:hypothetical protein A946_07510 [Methylacidiphilum kamchatkense Kam1]